MEHRACKDTLKLLHRHCIGRLFWPILSTIQYYRIFTQSS